MNPMLHRNRYPRSRVMAQVRLRRMRRERGWPLRWGFWRDLGHWVSMWSWMVRRDGWHPVWQRGYEVYEYEYPKRLWLGR